REYVQKKPVVTHPSSALAARGPTAKQGVGILAAGGGLSMDRLFPHSSSYAPAKLVGGGDHLSRAPPDRGPRSRRRARRRTCGRLRGTSRPARTPDSRAAQRRPDWAA